MEIKNTMAELKNSIRASAEKGTTQKKNISKQKDRLKLSKQNNKNKRTKKVKKELKKPMGFVGPHKEK